MRACVCVCMGCRRARDTYLGPSSKNISVIPKKKKKKRLHLFSSHGIDVRIRKLPKDKSTAQPFRIAEGRAQKRILGQVGLLASLLS